jgi:hypothetical protein
MTTQPAIPFLTGGDGNRLREAAITSLPGDSGQSFKDAVVDSVIDAPAWESRLISSSTNSNTPSAMTAQRTRTELCELVKFERGQFDFS